MPLYVDDETGKVISTHSMLKSFRRCPKQAEYKYERRLKPKTVSKPLKRGKWMHALLEAYYKGEDWERVHRHLSHKFSEMFDDEKEEYGDLPDECRRLMESYLWHYKHEDWVVRDVEFIVETEFPNGSIYRGKVDMMVENEFGLWLVDHKTHKTLPGHDYRLLDAQSALYLWAAIRSGYDVQGFIFNYIRTKAPTVPTLIKDGSRVSRWNTIDTDYPTAAKALVEFGLDLKPYAQKLKALKSQRFEPGTVQTSGFFQRAVIEKSPAMLKRVASENYHTAKRMHAYFESTPPEARERVVDRSCTYMCSFTDLCTIELYGGNTTAALKNYTEGDDPLAYQQDDKEDNFSG